MTDVAWLRGLGDDGLAALLRRRPEALAVPSPVSLTELAERLAMPASVVAVMRRLDRPTLQVGEVIAALGGRTDGCALDRLLGATSADVQAAVTGALDTLRECALLAPGPGLALVPAAAAAWPSPLGLGVPVAEVLDRRTADDLRAFARNLGLKPAGRRAEIFAQVVAALRDPALVCAVVDRAPAPARELLYKVAVTGEEVHDHLYFTSYQRVQTPAQWAIAHGLLVRAGDWESGLSMPAEVALALRGSGYVAPFDPVAPPVARVKADPDAVARDAVAAGSAMVRLVAALLDEAGRAPLAALTLWRQPYGFGDPDTAAARALAGWQEATLLGVVAGGSVSASGRALLDGVEDLAGALGDIGATQRTVRLQADLTAVVTGTPSADLTALLDDAADAETRGTAYTWRFSPASVRRALDAGYTATGLLADLRAVAGGVVPQPLEYLIGDVARRHGTVRASTVACCLRSEDTALLAEIAADRRLRALGLRHLAPTVLASGIPLEETLVALRKAGHAPVAEAADGTPVIERPAHRAVTSPTRAKATRRQIRRAPATPEPAQLARALLAAPDDRPAVASPSLATVRSVAINLTAGEARILANAIDNHRPIAINYLNRDGNPSSRVIDDIELSGNSLSAWCRLRDDHRWFNLARITAVGPITEADR